MRSLYAELMVVTTAALAVAVGISLWFLYAYSAATVRVNTATRLEAAVHRAEGRVEAGGGPALSALFHAQHAKVGGTLEMVDGLGHVYWIHGAFVPTALVRTALRTATRQVRLEPSGAVFAAGPVRIPGLSTPLYVLWKAPYHVPAFPNREETAVLISGLCAIVLSQILWAIVARRLTRPVTELASLLERYGQGDFEARVHVRGPREFTRLEAAMTQMAQQLASERQARETFLAEVAHDLRTPLTAVRGLLGSLRGRAEGADADRLVRAEREAERLTRLVNDLLDLARYEAGHLRVEVRRIDAREIALLATTGVEMLARQRDIRLDLDVPEEPVWADGDLDRGSQVLVNLLDNALRYAMAGGQVRVVVCEDAPYAAIRVEDTGPGFEPQAMDWAWSAFVRGKAARENDGGTGLGLAIGRALAEAMGGSLRILAPEPAGPFRGRVELRLRRPQRVLAVPVSPVSEQTEPGPPPSRPHGLEDPNAPPVPVSDPPGS